MERASGVGDWRVPEASSPSPAVKVEIHAEVRVGEARAGDMSMLLALLVALMLACGVAAGVTVNLAPAYADTDNGY